MAFGLGAQYSHFLNGAQAASPYEKDLLEKKIICLVNNMVDDLNHGSSTWSRIYGSLPAAPVALYGAYDFARKNLWRSSPTPPQSMLPTTIARSFKPVPLSVAGYYPEPPPAIIAPPTPLPKTDYLGKSLAAAALATSAYALLKVSKNTNSAIKNDILACIQKASASELSSAQQEAINTFIEFITELNKFDINAAKQIIKGQGSFHPIIGNVDKQIEDELEPFVKSLVDSKYEEIKHLQTNITETKYDLRLCKANKSILKFFKLLSRKSPTDSKKLRIKIFEIVKNYDNQERDAEMRATYQLFLTNLLKTGGTDTASIEQLIALPIESKGLTFYTEYNFHDFQAPTIQQKFLTILSTPRFVFLDPGAVASQQSSPQQPLAKPVGNQPAQAEAKPAVVQQPGAPAVQKSAVIKFTELSAFFKDNWAWYKEKSNFKELVTDLGTLNETLAAIRTNWNSISKLDRPSKQQQIAQFGTWFSTEAAKLYQTLSKTLSEVDKKKFGELFFNFSQQVNAINGLKN